MSESTLDEVREGRLTVEIEAETPRPVHDRHGDTWREIPPLIRLVALAVVATIVVAITVYIFRGYQYGYSDHTLLSIRGIRWAEPGAFENDWFDQRAPQPHWLFDVVTYLGDKTGHLPGVYFGYFLASMAAFGLGTALLADYWLAPGRRPLALAVGLLAAAGPGFALGTFLAVEGTALPNVLGGCLTYATVAALISRRRNLTVGLAVVTGLVHVQHGATIAVVLLLAAALQSSDWRAWRSRVPYVATAGFLLAMAAVVSRVRGLADGNGDMVEICNTASIGHCNANLWSWPLVRDGLLIVVLAAAVTVVRRRDWRTLVPVLALPAVAVVAGLYADRWDLGVLGELAQRTFIYRLVMVLAPFLAWLVVLLAAGVGQPAWRALVRAIAAGSITAFYLGATYSAFGTVVIEYRHIQAFGMLFGFAISAPMLAESFAPITRLSRLVALSRSAVVASAIAAGTFAPMFVLAVERRDVTWPRLGYDGADGYVWIGRQLEVTVPVGSIIAHPPEFDWVRLFSRRAVVGNCRAAPYGGEPWQEYKDRIRALGVTKFYECGRDGYEALTLADVVALRRRFGATHVALLGLDPKIAAAQAAGWKLVWYSGPGTEPWWVFEIPEAVGGTASAASEGAYVRR